MPEGLRAKEASWWIAINSNNNSIINFANCYHLTRYLKQNAANGGNLLMKTFSSMADENECLQRDSCGRNAKCYNTIGSFECACDTGYTGNPLIECTGKMKSEIAKNYHLLLESWKNRVNFAIFCHFFSSFLRHWWVSFKPLWSGGSLHQPAGLLSLRMPQQVPTSRNTGSGMRAGRGRHSLSRGPRMYNQCGL